MQTRNDFHSIAVIAVKPVSDVSEDYHIFSLICTFAADTPALPVVIVSGYLRQRPISAPGVN
jgi:hypothetical protein